MKEVCGFCFAPAVNGRKVKIEGGWVPVCKSHFDEYLAKLFEKREK